MQVMSLNITTNLQPKMDYFVGDLKIPRKSLGRIVGAFPQVLLLYCCFTADLLLLYCCFTAALLLLYCCFTAALLLLYCCFTAALLLLYCCFTAALLLLYFKNLYTVLRVPAAPHPQPRPSPDVC
jgi:hypothetical protein